MYLLIPLTDGQLNFQSNQKS